MVLNVHRNGEAYEGWGEGGKGGMEVGEEGDDYTTMTPALRWAVMRAILMFH